MASGAGDITFVVPGAGGSRRRARPTARRVKASVRVGTQRGGGDAGARHARGRARTSSCSHRQRADAGPPSRRRARPDAGAERGGDAQRPRRGDARCRRERGRRAGAARLARPRGRGDARQHARLDGPGRAQRLPGGDRPRQGPGRQARRRGDHQEGRRQGRRRRLSALGRRARAAEGQRPQARRGAGGRRRRAAAGAVHGTFSTPSAPSASSGRCTTRPCASCSRATAIASTRSTTRRWAPARSPTR